jgi:hypothetical protein
MHLTVCAVCIGMDNHLNKTIKNRISFKAVLQLVSVKSTDVHIYIKHAKI